MAQHSGILEAARCRASHHRSGLGKREYLLPADVRRLFHSMEGGHEVMMAAVVQRELARVAGHAVPPMPLLRSCQARRVCFWASSCLHRGVWGCSLPFSVGMGGRSRVHEGQPTSPGLEMHSGSPDRFRTPTRELLRRPGFWGPQSPRPRSGSHGVLGRHFLSVG